MEGYRASYSERTPSTNYFMHKSTLISGERIQRYEDVFNDFWARQENKYDKHFSKIYGVSPLRRDKDSVGNPRSRSSEQRESKAKNTPEDEPSENSDKHSETPGGARLEMIKLSESEKTMIHDHTLVSRMSTSVRTIAGLSDGDVQLERNQFTQKVLNKKLIVYRQHLAALNAELKRSLVAKARQTYPSIKQADYESPNASKKKKKKKSAKKATGEVMFVQPEPEREEEKAVDESPKFELEGIDVLEPRSMLVKDKFVAAPPVSRPGEVSEDVIYQRIMDDPEMLESFRRDSRNSQLELEAERMRDKLEEVQQRLLDTQAEERLLLAFSNDEYDSATRRDALPPEMHRVQSPNYRRLNPQIDHELNIDALEGALAQINYNMTSDELRYIYMVLELPGRKRINMKMFAVLAALSEKIMHLDPTVRNVIREIKFEELIGNIERAKELFQLLSEGSDNAPEGYVTVHSLIIELAAGSVPPHYIRNLADKLDPRKNGLVDLLDFMTYMPLFMEIHKNIVKDPLGVDASNLFRHMIQT